MAARKKSCGLIYLRRSGDRQETSLRKQFDWAIEEARKLGVAVDAMPADLEYMQAQNLSSYKSLRLDDAITGADLSRPGLTALVHDAQNDETCSHIFAFKRDRLARPDLPMHMMLVEEGIRSAGVTIVRSDGISQPTVGDDARLAEWVMTLFDYHRSGKFLKDLAEQMIHTQMQLAHRGFWTGGNPPYGFVRALANDDGEILEELPLGKRVSQYGCHTVVIPKDLSKIGVWILILQWKEQGWGFKRIVRHLNERGIPSPDAGRTRTDHGVRHLVSGRWNATTVRALCSNKIITGMLEYGRRSEGKHRRLGADGPRQLEESDHDQGNKPKRIFNDPTLMITSKAHIEPQFDPARWDVIQAETAKRGKVQRGIPRTRDPARYPLSCRVVDLSDGCGSIMYARTDGKRPVYVCGRYMATGGADCEKNTVDGEAMLRFTLDTLVELTDRFGAREKLRQKLMERAMRERPTDPLADIREADAARLQGQIKVLQGDVDKARHNLATETDPDLRDDVRTEYRRIKAELTEAQVKLDMLPKPVAEMVRSPEAEVDSALNLLDNIRQVATDLAARAKILPMVQRLGMRIGLRFVDGIKGTKRRVRRLIGGVIAFDDAPFPIGCGDGHGQPGHGEITCEVRKSRLPIETAPSSSHLLEGAGRFESCPQEGVSITKGSRGETMLLRSDATGVVDQK